VPIETFSVTQDQIKKVISKGEGHFSDLKGKQLSPAKLTKSLSAFANADGGELFIGFDEPKRGQFAWNGFDRIEDANGHIQAFDDFFPLGTHFSYYFWKAASHRGFILHCEIDKTADIRNASDGIAYLRRGAQNLPQNTPKKLTRLRYSKGIHSFEDQLTKASLETVTNSLSIIEFSLEIIPTAEPEAWLRKQKLIVDDRPTVGGVILFSDETQVDLPKAAIKLYRYKTTQSEGTSDTLAFNPIAIERNAYSQIYETVSKIKEVTETIPVMGPVWIEKFEYPTEAIHEIVTNAVIHRDYSLNDDIHVRIFDNRIEVASPGALPAQITVENILDERFARNPKIVRILNKYKNPPNKDVGEGLNTAFEAMRKLKFKDPLIAQRDNNVIVSLRHEKLEHFSIRLGVA
jgi:ATP-dependent DNA helicase RecG